ncbi:MAG: hypothetical protein GXP62_18650 [Oligoflexia bacterium]|nr:hypothetical protein [Oligoflexia bacterium]
MATNQDETPSPERIAAFQALVDRVQIRDVQLVRSMCTAEPTFALTHGSSQARPEFSLDFSSQGRILAELSMIMCMVDIDWVAFPTDSDEELLRVEQRYMVTFALEEGDELSEETVDDFARHNATVHAWPFAREAIRSATARMGVPPAVLPLLKPA